MEDNALEFTKELIARPSITPKDEGCQEMVAGTLSTAGFTAEPMRFGEVDNLWLRRNNKAPLLVFAGIPMLCPRGPWTNGALTHSCPPYTMVIFMVGEQQI